MHEKYFKYHTATVCLLQFLLMFQVEGWDHHKLNHKSVEKNTDVCFSLTCHDVLIMVHWLFFVLRLGIQSGKKITPKVDPSRSILSRERGSQPPHLKKGVVEVHQGFCCNVVLQPPNAFQLLESEKKLGGG